MKKFLLKPKRMKFFISLMCIELLLTGSLPLNMAKAAKNNDTSMEVLTSMDLDKIIIPMDIGKVEETYEGLEDSLIVHIQDVHCHYEAQKNIANILDILASKNNITLFGLEGAKGNFISDKFHVLQNQDVRERVANYLMKKGKITGAEYLAISTDLPIVMQGIEEKDSFMEHFHAFAEPWKFRNAFVAYYDNVQELVNSIEQKIYSEDLIELDKKEQALTDGETSLVDFCNYLKDILIAKQTKLKDYKNFARLVTLDHLEKGIDFDNVHKEQVGLLNFLGPRLDEDEIMEIRQVVLDFKNQRISSEDYYKYLKRLSDKKEIVLSRFPNIAFYFQYLEMYAKLDFGELLKEKKHLVKLLKDKLFTTEDQRAVNEISYKLNLIKQLFALRVSNEEYQEFKSFKKSFTSKYIKDTLSEIAQKNDVQGTISEKFEFDQKFDFMENFYDLAKQRNEDLFNNTLSFMKGEDSNTAILISGGFHTKGMLELMKQKDIGYAVIAPTISREHDYNLYVEEMIGDFELIEKLFSIQLPESSAIPPPLTTAESPFIPARQRQLITSTVIYDLALEIVGIIKSSLDLTDKISLPPADQDTVFKALGGNDYLDKISTTLGVKNIDIDLKNIQVEGGQNGVIVIPIRIFDMQFQAAVIDSMFDIDKTPSILINKLDQSGLTKQDMPELNMKLFFTGIQVENEELLKQDKFIDHLRKFLPAPGLPQLVPGAGTAVQDAVDAQLPINQLSPQITVDPAGEPIGRIDDYEEKGKGDSLVIFNVNGANIIGIAESFSDPSFQKFPTVGDLDVSLYTMLPYSADLNAKTAFPLVKNENSLGQILASSNVSQSRIVGTRRVNDLTQALDGNAKVTYTPDNYTLVEVDDPSLETIKDNPEYNTNNVAEKTIERINQSDDQVVMANFSALDIIAETGDIIRTAEAIDILDEQLGSVIDEAQKAGMTVMLTGTHGNVESMLDENDNPIKGRYFSYTDNPVPFLYIDGRDNRLKTQKNVLEEDLSLASVSPSILEILGLETPETMTAPSLFKGFAPQQNSRVLVITIDGLGVSDITRGNALELARQTAAQQNRQLNLDKLAEQYPSTNLTASGKAMGLRDEQPGYPTANYFALGSGLAEGDIALDMLKIDNAIANDTFLSNPAFVDAVDNAIKNGTKLHLLGLVSEAEVESSIEHLEALLNLAKKRGMKKEDVIIHAISDGINEAPNAVVNNIKRVELLADQIGVGTLATVGGRYWFMNQDNENTKIEKAYNSLVSKKLKEQVEEPQNIILLPDEMIDNSLGLREALTVVRQQYGTKTKIGVLSPKSESALKRILQVNNIADKIDFVISERELESVPTGLIDPIIDRITAKYPNVTEPSKQVAIITLDLNKLGVDAARKAQVFVQEKPQGPNEVFSVANGLFAAVMTLEGHDNDLVTYEGWVEGKPRTLRTIPVQRNFLDQLNRQREINQMFEAAA